MFLTLIFFFCLNFSYAQPGLPQRTITVQPTQSIDFGTFYITSAGTITVNWDGTVSTTGGVFLLSSSTVHPAIFDIKLCQGREVTISYNDPITNLTNGASNLTLNIGDNEKGPDGCSFLVNNNCNFITTIRVGGTLTVPGGSTTGTYSGNFSINFTQK